MWLSPNAVERIIKMRNLEMTMAAYLLTWNPKRWAWEDLEDYVTDFNRGKVRTSEWSCGRNKSIAVGDRVWLIRVGEEPRGIFCRGLVTRDSYEDDHWSADDKKSRYIDFEIDGIVNPEAEPIITRERLDEPPFDVMHWSTQSSGISIPEDVSRALEDEWERLLVGNPLVIPEEIVGTQACSEGARYQVTVNAYERNPRARAACIQHYGPKCAVCELVLADAYGPAGEGLIHVHHLLPIASVGEEYRVDPIKDLRPVCPNCHAIIHRRNPPFEIEEVQQMLAGKASALGANNA